MKNATGIIVGAISGYYDVEIDKKVVRTRARGVFRGRKQKPLVGDRVEVQLDDKGMNYLVKIFPRENEIGRPAVANVAQVLLVISAVEPDFSTELLDRYLTFFSWQRVGVEIYLSKTDLVSEEKLIEIKQILNYYRKIGYPIFLSSRELEEQLPDLVQKDEVWT